MLLIMARGLGLSCTSKEVVARTANFQPRGRQGAQTSNSQLGKDKARAACEALLTPISKLRGPPLQAPVGKES
jgi:hypothetical protein